MRGTDKLSDKGIQAFVKQVQAGTAPTAKRADGKGLYLMLTPSGTPVWRVRFRLGGKTRDYAVGLYPEITLQVARLERDRVRALVRKGLDPVKERQLGKAGNAVASADTFAAAAEAWLDLRKADWSTVHYKTTKRALDRDVIPFIGALPMRGITTPMYTRVIARVVKRGSNETAGKILYNIRRIWALASTRDVALSGTNPADAVQEILLQSKPYAPRPALLTFAALGDFLRRADLAPLTRAVYLAHRLTAFTVSRVGNIVAAEWSEFDLDRDTPTWTIARAKMKVRGTRSRKPLADHRVLLGPTITRELQAWRAATGGRGYVFPPPYGDGEYITRESLEKSYRKTLGMGGKHSVHGWRASFATLAKDAGFSRDVVELSLDHTHDNEVVRAYDRGERLDERRKLMYWWDANLTAAQRGDDPKVTPLGARQRTG